MAESNRVAMADAVKQVERRVDLLIADHSRLSEQNRELLEERSKLVAARREQQQQIDALKRELDMRTLQDGLESVTKDPKRATAYINRLLREVDNCMALMNTVKP